MKLSTFTLLSFYFILFSPIVFAQESNGNYKYKIELDAEVGRLTARWENGKFVVRIYPVDGKLGKYEVKLEHIDGGIVPSSIEFLSEVTKSKEKISSTPIGYVFSLPADLKEFFVVLEDGNGNLVMKSRVRRRK